MIDLERVRDNRESAINKIKSLPSVVAACTKLPYVGYIEKLANVYLDLYRDFSVGRITVCFGKKDMEILLGEEEDVE